MSDSRTHAQVLLAPLYERLGGSGRALAAIGRRSYFTGWPRYQARAAAGAPRHLRGSGAPKER